MSSLGAEFLEGKLTCFEEGVVLNNELWYVAVPRAWLCKMDLLDYKVQVVCEIPFMDVNAAYTYNVVAVYDNKLILMPKYAEDVLIYDIGKDEFEKIELKKALRTSGKDAGNAVKFRAYALKDNVLWMMPQSSCCILEYNLLTGKLIEHVDWYEQFERYNWENVNLFGKGIMAENSLWIPCYQLNAIVEFRIETKESILHFIGSEKDCYSAITYTNGKFWLFNAFQNSLCKWNRESGIVTECIVLNKEYEEDDVQLSEEMKKYKVNCMYALNNKIVLLPSQANQCILVDIGKKRGQTLFKKNKGASFIGICDWCKGKIICPSQNENSLVIISIDEKKAQSIKWSVILEDDKVSCDESLTKYVLDIKRIKRNRVQSVNINSFGSGIYKVIKG